MSETTPEATTAEVDYAKLLGEKDLDTGRFLDLRKELFGSPKDRRAVRRSVESERSSGPGTDTGRNTEVGICLAAIGEHEHAIAFLEKCNATTTSRFALVKCRVARRDLGTALTELAALRKESDNLDLVRTEVEIHEQAQDMKALEKMLGSSKLISGTADEHYGQGLLHESAHRFDEATGSYRQAIEADPAHARALFRLAYRLDMAGSIDEAIELYERCRDIRPTYSAVFLNLGVLYDDTEEYQKAIDCFKQLLQLDPTNERAKLFLKDAVGSLDMYYDEDQERREDKLNQILKIPVTDFELSVRSRNCLERMKIRTLGDLIKKTEPELLSYKNFGETSLAEIKEILASKNLKLGMGREELERTAGAPDAKIEKLKAMITGIGTQSDDVVSKPIAELELSVRSRRCMTRLGIQTIGELVLKSEAELLATRNFGQTSLVEIKEKLQNLGLNLADSK